MLLPQGTQEEPSENAALEDPEHELHVNPVRHTKKNGVVKKHAESTVRTARECTLGKTKTGTLVKTRRADTGLNAIYTWHLFVTAKTGEDTAHGLDVNPGSQKEQIQW